MDESQAKFLADKVIELLDSLTPENEPLEPFYISRYNSIGEVVDTATFEFSKSPDDISEIVD